MKKGIICGMLLPHWQPNFHFSMIFQGIPGIRQKICGVMIMFL
jgi:hypothetical protein